MNSTELLSFVAINGMDLTNGTNKRMVCPACNAEHEKSFMIRKTELGELTGYCFRVSCPIYGKVIGQKGVYAREARTKISSFKPRVYEGSRIQAPLSLKLWLFQQYNIPISQLKAEGLGYDEVFNRMVWPVYDWKGDCFGHMTKKMPMAANDNYPKWITYFERETNKLHYPRANAWTSCTDTVVLVEDTISAIRIAQHIPSVALLGTHMTQGMVNELRQIWPRVIIALDPDATGKALKMQQKFGSFFQEGITVRPMNDDPKDILTDLDLLTQLGEVQWM